jgi:hypothetical protein
VRHGPCRLHQGAAEPAVSLICPAASSFAAALVVAGSQNRQKPARSVAVCM